MAIVLGPNRYGKAEIRVVRVNRDGDAHRVADCTVSVALSGDMAAVHLSGDNSSVLPTDTQKNTVYAFARKHGIDQIETFALLLARHFVDSQPAVHRAKVAIEEYLWDRIPGGPGWSFVRAGGETRTCAVHHDRDGTSRVVSGLKDLVVLNTTGSEFHGFARDEYTTLAPTTDRMLASEVTAAWRHTSPDAAFGESYREVRRCLLEAFAQTHSLSLQQTLHAMGARALAERPEICEVRLAMPNRHHFLVDLAPFALDNPGEVYFAADRPYGRMEGHVLRDDAPDAAYAWE